MASKDEKNKTSSRTKRTRSTGLADQIRDVIREELSTSVSRKQTLNTYVNRLGDADNKVMEFVQNVIKETIRAYRTTLSFYIVSYIAASILLLGGVALALFSFISQAQPSSPQTNISLPISIFCILVGIIGMILLQSRNPVKNLRYLVDNLVKLNVIFVGFVRQIHQVDAVFEELVGSGKDITPETSEQLLSNLQDAMTEAMNAISIISSELTD